ncbi:hypothetical protein FF2_009855 [Malus domestica]
MTSNQKTYTLSQDLLSSTHLSNWVSDGSRLRVAYQGVHGAYNESAAEKAYSNYEAVPCKQFDTAFEVYTILCSHNIKRKRKMRSVADAKAKAEKR